MRSDRVLQATVLSGSRTHAVAFSGAVVADNIAISALYFDSLSWNTITLHSYIPSRSFSLSIEHAPIMRSAIVLNSRSENDNVFHHVYLVPQPGDAAILKRERERVFLARSSDPDFFVHDGFAVFGNLTALSS